MNLISPPLKPGDTSDAVTNLQDALLFLLERGAIKALEPPNSPTADELRALAEKLRAERASQLFGDATRQLVFLLQIQNGLGDHRSGVVDEPTAELLNRLLKQHGAPLQPGGDPGNADLRYTVRCRVVDGRGQPLAGLRIELFDQDPRSPHDPLGEPAVTDVAGLATFRFRRSDFSEHPGERGPDLFFAVTSDAVALDYTLPGIENDQGVIRNFQPRREPIELRIEKHVVQGRVTDGAGRARGGLKVVAYDRDLFDGVWLGDAATDADGRYRILYRPEKAAAGEAPTGTAPDLEVRVLPDEGVEPLAVSPVRFNARLVETIDLVVPALESEPVEFDEIMRRVKPMLGERSALELNEEHIAFIVGDTGLAPEAVRAWVAGARLRADALALLGSEGPADHRTALETLGWPYGHAWHRIGWSGTLAGMLGSGPALWEAALDGGVERRWITAPDAEQRKGLLAALAYLGTVVTVDPTYSADPLARAVAPYTGKLPRELAAAALRNFEEQGEQALDELPALAGDNQELTAGLSTLARAIRVHNLAEGHAELVEPLMARLDGPGTGIEGLLTLKTDDWLELTRSAIRTEGEATMLAYRMQAGVERASPALALLTRLDQGAIAIADGLPGDFRSIVAENQGPIGRVMLGTETEADDEFISKHSSAADYAKKVGGFLKTGLQAVHADKLVRGGVSPGGAITNWGPSGVMHKPGPDGPLGSELPPEVQTFLKRAQHWFERDISRLLSLDTPWGWLGIPESRYQPGKTPKVDLPAFAPGISSPTVRGMFGDLDDCICRPCESVLGHGAYLVDLLRALQREVLGKSGLDLLRERRPDILDLELTCENVDVRLPHIDLALEQLEWAAVTTKAQDLSLSGPATLTLPLPTDLVLLLGRTTARPVVAGDLTLSAANFSASAAQVWFRDAKGGRSWLLDGGPETQGARTWTLRTKAIRRTDANPEPLLEPADSNPRAYEILADPHARYPWVLPFERERHDRSALLETLRVDPVRVGQLAPGYEPSSQATNTLSQLDLDTLGLGPGEVAILQQAATGDGIWQAWGFANDNPITRTPDPSSGEELSNVRPSVLLQRASFLLARSGLSLDELEAVLATTFVGGYRLTNRSQCKTSAMEARRGDGANATPIDGAALERLHRLVRLWRKLPAWPLPALDAALASLRPSATAAPVLDIQGLRLLAAMERARRALGLSAAEVLQLSPLMWTQGQWPLSAAQAALLARGLRRSEAEVQALLVWQGWTPAAPQGGSTSAPERTVQLDRLAALKTWSDAFAQCDLPLLDLAAAGAPRAQVQTGMAPRPTGARTTAALTQLLRDLQTQLAAVADPAPPLGERALRSAVVAELRTLGWTDELPEALEKEFDNPSGADFSDPLIKALSQTPYRFEPGVDARPLLSETERQKLASPSIQPQERFAFLHDRLVELRGVREREVSARLGAILGPVEADTLLLGLKSSDGAARARAVRALAEGDASNRPLGTVMPLFTRTEAETRFLRPGVLDSWRSRLDQIDARLAERERERILLQALRDWAAASGADWSPQMAAAFLGDRLTIPPATANDPVRSARSLLLDPSYRSATNPPAEIVEWVTRLDTVIALSAGSATAAALSALPGLDWRLLIHVPVPAGQTIEQTTEARGRLVHLLRLADANRLSIETLSRLLDPQATPQTVLDALATRLRLDVAQVTELARLAARINSTPQPTLEHLRNPVVLARLFDLAEEARRLKATAAELGRLLGQNVADAIAAGRALLERQVGPREWPKQLRRLSDESRRRRRDALVAYLVQTLPDVRDADGLFERLLIDPQMQPCLETTRLRQAVASLQMLIQRILEGLEPGALATDKLRRQWSWMRSYRLWEANRKVFLYPENWLLPELRDDQSPEFRALLSRLAEDELTPERAHQAFGLFIEDVNQTAQTQVLGMFETPSPDQPTVRDLFVVGRSPNPPYVYRWRQCRDFGSRWMEWTPWERIDADIQTDHLVPFVANGAFQLAWPVIEEQGSGSDRKWKIELATTLFDGGGWTKVRTSRVGEGTEGSSTGKPEDPTIVEQVPLEDRRSALAFRVYVPISGTTASIHAYIKDRPQGTVFTVPQPKDPVRRPLTPPQRFLDRELLDLGGRQELAELVAAVFDNLSAYSQDLIELYLHRTIERGARGVDVNGNPITVDGPTPGYALIPENELFTKPEHLAWHRRVRNDRTEEHVRTIILPRRKNSTFLQGFLRRFHEQTFPRSFRYINPYKWTEDPYTSFVRDVMKHCSGVELTCLAWAKYGTPPYEAFKQLSGDPQLRDHIYAVDSTALLRGRRVFLGRPEVFIRPAKTPAGRVVLIAGTSSNNGETMVPSAQAVVEQNDGIAEVDAGYLGTQTLHFVFNARSSALADTTAFSQLFGDLPASNSFRRTIFYDFQPTGRIAAQQGDGTSLESPSDASFNIWMNGFREKSPYTHPLHLNRFGGTPLGVFDNYHAAERSELTPSAIPAFLALNNTKTWHFREGLGTCYIDASVRNSAGSPAETLIFPNAWLNGVAIASAWYTGGRLPEPTNQRDDYGLNVLPPLGRPLSEAKGIAAIRAGNWTYDLRMPNAGYWWELCFHAPMAIADQLSRQQRFAEADRWLRMIYDPLTNSPGDPQAFLRFRRFRELPRARSVSGDLKALAKAAADNTSAPSVERVRATIERWRSQPFRPFVIARRRHVAFLWRTLFAYLENLIAWADSLYRRETRESIQEALLLYIQVARLLGPRPRRVRRTEPTAAKSFLDYQGFWDEFANAWVEALPADAARRSTSPRVLVEDAEGDPPPEGLLYFCVPPNDRILGYWDLIEERLRNIRHCRSIDGVERSLPLDAPPIDIDALLRSVAAGTSPEDFLAEAYAQPWPYRYATLLAQTKELVGDVRNLGAQLLAALEKRDAEKLAQLRSTHELALLERVTEVRRLQVVEAERQLDSLRASREAVAARYEQLQQQLGNDGAKAPGPNEVVGAESRLGRLSSGNNHADRNLGLITQEADQLEQLHYAHWYTDADSVARLVAWAFNTASAGAHVVSIFEKGAENWAKALGALGSAASSTADGFRAIAQIHHTQASRLAQTAANFRRRDEWAFQSNQALRELATIDRQIAASEARLAIVKQELANHELQREQAAATDAYLREKFTNAALYQWQSNQLLTLHRSVYGLALAMARRTRQAAVRELAAEQLPAVRDHWNSGPYGLTAGERLQRELKMLELAVLEQHTREQELTRHVSLRRLNPRALMDLISAGKCDVEIPEWLFDLDAPGHYLRRIKTVSVTIPCVTGPYAGINAKLTLLRSDIRRRPQPASRYQRDADADERFETRFHGSESIFISTGREDSGLFETNLRDERYLPFEGAGAISSWCLEFPSEVPQFDRTTISDVVLHIRFTARDGGEGLAGAASDALTQRWASSGTDSLQALLSIRTEFAAEWNRARQTQANGLTVDLDVGTLLPYWMLVARIDSIDPNGCIAFKIPTSGSGRDVSTADADVQRSANGTSLSVSVPSDEWSTLQDLLVLVPARRRSPPS